MRTELNQIILYDASASTWLLFRHPVDVIFVHSPGDVVPALQAIEQRVRRERLFAAGFVGYEAASGFDPAFRTLAVGKLPVLGFGLFASVEEVAQLTEPAACGKDPHAWSFLESRECYGQKLAFIKDQIGAGNLYQVNHTVRLSSTGIEPAALFHRVAQTAPYAAYIDAGEFAIVSASPELFFKLNGGALTCQPMKGTAPRGTSYADDLEKGHWLRTSEKNRAENLMITDMVRNDMGRIAVPGSVRVPKLFDVERYSTLWQMTSTVTCRTRASVAEIFTALFPAASITGAPKVASMRLIRELETLPREIYSGSIGYIKPDGASQFNVAIRTAWFDKLNAQGTYGVGGGIVWDSNLQEEYQELLTKTKVLSSLDSQCFELLEALLWTPAEGFFLLDHHLQRLRNSAEYFEFAFDEKEILVHLEREAAGLTQGRYKFRLLLGREGAIHVERAELGVPSETPLKVVLAQCPIDATDHFLHHKTTYRRVYEEALSTLTEGEDVLLYNTEGYVTESSIANVIFRQDGRLFTPPLECGLLAGTFRQWLLENNEISERKLAVGQLDHVEALFLVNSVRGWRQVELVAGSGVKRPAIPSICTG